MIYKASSGNEYDLTLKRHYLKTASFHDWEWSPKTKEKAIGVNVSKFGRDAKIYEAVLALPGARSEREKRLLSDSIEDVLKRFGDADTEQHQVLLSLSALVSGSAQIVRSSQRGRRNIWRV